MVMPSSLPLPSRHRRQPVNLLCRWFPFLCKPKPVPRRPVCLNVPSPSLLVDGALGQIKPLMVRTNGGWKYSVGGTAPAAYIDLGSGTLTFATAPGGALDAAASFTDRMTIGTTGIVTVNVGMVSPYYDLNGQTTLQGASSGLRVAAYGSGASGGARGPFFASSGDFSDALSAAQINGTYATSGDYISVFRHTHASNPLGIYMKYNNAAPNGTSNEFLTMEDSGVLRFVVRSNGGIANFSANNVNLSDRRLKSDIANMPSFWDAHLKFPYRVFKFNDQSHSDLNLGTVAQEVQITMGKWASVLVDDSNPDRLGIYETDRNYMVGRVVQELQERVLKLEKNSR